MKINYILFFFFLFTTLNAQKVHTVKLEPTYNHNLNGFLIDSIIDMRIAKSNIGFAQKGLANKRVAAVFPDSFAMYLKNTIQKIIPQFNEYTKLTAIVYEFNVSEHTKAMKELGTFRIQIELAIEKENNLYSLGYIETQIEGSGMDVTKGHAKRIIEGLNYCLEEFGKMDWKNNIGDLIDLNAKFEFDFRKIPPVGLYSSFTKMCEGEPFKTDGYKIKVRSDKFPKYFIEDERGKRITNRVMGFTTEKYIFLNASRYCYSSHFTRSIDIGRYIYFEDKFMDPNAAALFGLIGAAASTNSRAIVFDTKTGLVKILTEQVLDEILLDYPDISSTYRNSKKKLKHKQQAILSINEFHRSQ